MCYALLLRKPLLPFNRVAKSVLYFVTPAEVFSAILQNSSSLETDSVKDRAVPSPRKKGSLTPLSGLQFHRKEIQGRSKGSVSSVSRVDEPSQRDEISHSTARVENTYQLGPRKHFPMVTVNHILKDVLTKYLQEEKYEAEFCRKMTKTLSEVIKTQVKELMIPRYKLIVVTHIGQLKDQSLFIGSRCLWDPKSDTVSSYIFQKLFSVCPCQCLCDLL